jgi:glycosyltransferase involved in cell wall biosynthesis
MMNILYFVPNPPSLVRVRPYNLIRSLVARGHRVTVATTWSDAAEQEDIEKLRSMGLEVMAARLPQVQVFRNVVRAWLAGVPMQATYSESPALERALVAWVQAQVARGDAPIVHVEHLRGACYGLHLRERLHRAGQRVPVVWDSVDCISYLFEQASAHSRSLFGKLVTRLELGRTRRHEGWLVRQFDRVLVTSDIDRQALLRLAQGGSTAGDFVQKGDSIDVLPNGVDLAYFYPTDEPRDPATILFSGKMSYHANVTAALHLIQDIMPRVWDQCPEARVVIAGKDPAPELRKLERPDGKVAFTGTVPDLRPYIRRATVAVSPLLYGAGIQNKVLEAMACATPVVASPKAAAALSAVDGSDLLIAPDAPAFADAILRVLRDTALQRGLSTAGRRYVERTHNWVSIAQRLEEVYLAVRPSKMQ